MRKFFFAHNFVLCFFLLIVTAFFSPFLYSQTYNFYYGNLHAHSDYSDGNKDKSSSHVNTPAGSYAYAKNSKNFDFLGISEHNHYTSNNNPGMHLEDYSKGLQQADDENDDGDFVCLYGMEYGVIKGGGHVLIYGVDSLIGWETNNYDIFNAKKNYKTLWKLLAERPNSFAILAHPEDDHFQNLLHTAYNLNADAALVGVTIKTGPAFSTKKNYSEKPPGSFYSFFRVMLSKGYHVGPNIDHDTHNTVFGRSHQSRTVVLAEELNRDNIMEAFRQMRFYASEDSNAKVEFTINDSPMGSIIPGSLANIEIKVEVTDHSSDKVASIKILTGKPGSNQISTVLSGGTAKNTNVLHLTKSVSNTRAYFYVEVIQKDGDKIYTSPIWINE